MARFDDTLNRKTREHGTKFDPSDLASAFVPYYNSGERIKVRAPWGDETTGTVGMTTGWRPAFLLMRTSRSIGSSYVLRETDTVIAVKRGRVYVEVK